MGRLSMGVLVVLLLALLMGIVQAQEPTIPFRGYNWFDSHISFDYDPSLGEYASSRYIPMDQELMMPGGPMPETVRIAFERFAEDGWQPTGAFIDVYHMSTFPGADQPATVARDAVLELLGTDTAALAAQAAAYGLPSINQLTASQVLATQAAPIDFQTGSGFRFITAAAQDVAPLTNHRLYYNFQGVTRDGRYFVAAVFPVSVPLLPDDINGMDAAEYETFAAGYEQYIADIVQQLETLPAADFAPDLALLDAIIGSLAVESPTMTFYPRESTIITYEDITLRVDPTLAHRVEVNTHPGVSEQDGEFSMFGPEPGFISFDLAGYPFTETFLSPRIEVFRTADFPSADHVFGRELAELRAFLAERPPLTSRAADWEAEPLPLGIPLNAAQVIVAQPQYINFGSGTGLRFIAYYAQDVSPVTNDGVFYAFAGLTADGKHLITARLPISVPFLPGFEDIDHATFDYEGFIAELDTYYADLLDRLDALPGDAYKPSLDQLDALLASVTIE